MPVSANGLDGAGLTDTQTFTVTPADEATNEMSTSSVDNTGRHSYSVSGITSATVDIALFPAENVSVDGDGVVSFSSNATVGDSTGVSIETVNGSFNVAAATTAGDAHVNDVTVTDGGITFAIDSVVADEVIPVVFDDADDDDALDHTDGDPTEAFGIGGQKNWVPAEATAGGAVTVTDTNTNLDYFVATGGTPATATYFYDSNDAYALNAAPISQAQFEGLLTSGDLITVTYEQDEADQSVFNVTTDFVPVVTNLEAEVSDLDGDGTADDATLTWTASDQADATYTVYVDVNSNTTLDAGDTVVEAGITGTSATVNDATATTYSVSAEGAMSGAVSTVDPNVSPAAPVDAQPAILANGAVVDVDNGNDDTASDGDVWVLYVSEEVNVSTSAAIELSTGAVYENGDNATFSGSGTDAITITLNADPTAASPYPATISAVSGITDADEGGQALDITPDVTLEDGGPEIYTDTADTGDVTFTVTFNEAVIEASAENTGNCTLTETDAESIASATLGADGRTVTLTITDVAGDGLDASSTLATTVVDTDGQASAQVGYALN